MKKTLALAVILLGIKFGYAQNIALGFKVGANLTKITGKAFKEGYELGYNAGAFAEISISNDIGIQPEILFNQVNTRKASGIDSIYNSWQQNTSDLQLNYLTIPILLRINVTKAFILNVGPQYGILLNKNESLWSNGKEALKSGEFSMIGGFTVNAKSIRVFGRYIIGLNSINDLNNSDSWKSQQIHLGVGFKL